MNIPDYDVPSKQDSVLNHMINALNGDIIKLKNDIKSLKDKKEMITLCQGDLEKAKKCYDWLTETNKP